MAVFEDDVDLNTHPKVGCMWMRRREQAVMPTPGTNEKRYLAGSLNWRTGTLVVTHGHRRDGRNTRLFLRHLDDFRRWLRHYRRIHVICDDARFHDRRGVYEYLGVPGDRTVIHFAQVVAGLGPD